MFMLAPSRGTPYAEVSTAPARTQPVSTIAALPSDPPTAFATSTESVTSTAAPSAIQGGLGLTKNEWEAGHTQTGKDVVGAIYDDRFVVLFIDDRAAYIEEQWTTENAISEAEVELIANQLIPADAMRVETYSPEGRPETIVHVYSSESLATLFSPDQWGGVDAGTFTVQYNQREGRVTRLILALGNNP